MKTRKVPACWLEKLSPNQLWTLLCCEPHFVTVRSRVLWLPTVGAVDSEAKISVPARYNFPLAKLAAKRSQDGVTEVNSGEQPRTVWYRAQGLAVTSPCKLIVIS